MSFEAELADSTSRDVLGAAVIPSGARKAEGQKEQRMDMEEFRAQINEYASRLSCRLDNAKLPQAQNIDCTDPKARQAREGAPRAEAEIQIKDAHHEKNFVVAARPLRLRRVSGHSDCSAPGLRCRRRTGRHRRSAGTAGAGASPRTCGAVISRLTSPFPGDRRSAGQQNSTTFWTSSNLAAWCTSKVSGAPGACFSMRLISA